MYYQTPAMRSANPDTFLPGETEDVDGGVAVAIKKPNGKYLTVLADGTDAESDEILDQEKFIVTNNKSVVVADRMHKDPPMCYTITLLTEWGS